MSTILVIEDNMDSARLVSRLMQSYDHHVLHAATGLDGLKLARTEHPDLILADINLPDLDGKIVVHQLRAEARFSNIPIIAFTSDNSERTRRLAISFGCTDFISKPIDPLTFCDYLEQFLKTTAATD